MHPLVSLENVHKSFGGVKALNGVTINLYPGEIVGLVGDNGAGKSTLIKMISGVLQYDEGKYIYEGKNKNIKGPLDASRLGIQTVYQDLSLCNNLDAVQNLFLGREESLPWWSGYKIKRAVCEVKAKEVLKKLRLENISLKREVGAMSGGQRQNIAIARSLLYKPKVILFDEPTAALSFSAAKKVSNIIRELAGQDLAILVVSHDIHKFIMDITDRIEVLRLGKIAGSFKTNETTGIQIVNTMVGGNENTNLSG